MEKENQLEVKIRKPDWKKGVPVAGLSVPIVDLLGGNYQPSSKKERIVYGAYQTAASVLLAYLSGKYNIMG